MVDSEFHLVHPRLQQLHALWLHHRGQDALPAAFAFTAGELRPWIGNILLVEVTEAQDFIYRYYGQALTDAFGADMVGRSLEGLPPDQRDLLVSEYERARTLGLAISRTYTAQFEDEMQTWERLVLPLSEDGGTTARLLVAAYRLEPRGRGPQVG